MAYPRELVWLQSGQQLAFHAGANPDVLRVTCMPTNPTSYHQPQMNPLRGDKD